MRQPLKYVAQPRIRLLAGEFGGLDQAVDLGAGRGAFGRVAEQPGFSSDGERPDCSFGSVVVDG